ncbi:MAG: TauD/TfdA dioxygenase family protein, partial [Reyranellaceae bacterium]
PYIFEVIKEPSETRNFGGGWHSDTTYLEKPPLATLLYAVETPASGGDTVFANTAAAYDALSDGMKSLIAPLKGIYSAGLKRSGGRANIHRQVGAMKIQNAEQADTYEAIHPIARTHPETGRKALYVSKGHTIRIESMSEDESRPLIDYLADHSTRLEFTCRVRWEPGTLTVWDNRCTQHNAINAYHGQRRRMLRHTVGAQVPAYF